MSHSASRFVILGVLQALVTAFAGTDAGNPAVAAEAIRPANISETPSRFENEVSTWERNSDTLDWAAVVRQGGRDLGPARLYTVHQPVQDAPYRVSIGGEVLRWSRREPLSRRTTCGSICNSR